MQNIVLDGASGYYIFIPDTFELLLSAQIFRPIFHPLSVYSGKIWSTTDEPAVHSCELTDLPTSARRILPLERALRPRLY